MRLGENLISIPQFGLIFLAKISHKHT